MQTTVKFRREEDSKKCLDMVELRPGAFTPFKLEVLTPVHIGSGADFPPLEYVIKQMPAGYEVWLIDIQSWLAANYADKSVAKALDEGDMASLRRLVAGSPGLEAHKLGVIPVSSAALGKELAERRNMKDSEAEIMSFARNPFTHLPYVPASSIKGAISTAITSYLNDGRPDKLRPGLDAGAYRGVMAKMYGEISSHAMRAMRMADIALRPGSTSIVKAAGRDLGKAGKTVTKTPCEAMNPAAVNGLGAYGAMRLASREGACIFFPDSGGRLSLADIRRICNGFYRKRFDDELAKYYGDAAFAGVKENLADAKRRVAAINGEQEFLLRLGRYSHIESVTVCDHKPGGMHMGGPGISRTLADNALPFGWIIVKACGMEEYEHALAAADLAFADSVGALTGRVEKARQEKERKEAAEARRRAEAEAEQRKAEALAALSAEERAIFIVEQPDAIENQASELYKMLDSLGDLQQRAALALKAFYMREGKWEKKKINKKQQEKVAKVRGILGE